MNKQYIIAIIFTLVFIFSTITLSIIGLIKLTRTSPPASPPAPSPSPVPSPVPPSPVPSPSGGGTAISDLSNVYFETLITKENFPGEQRFYLKFNEQIYGNNYLVKDIYIDSSDSRIINKYKFQLDSNNRLIYSENERYVNLDQSNVLTFSTQPTINSIIYDSSTNIFTNVDQTGVLADVLLGLGINQIPYLVLNWVPSSEVLDLPSNNSTIKTELIPSSSYSIKAGLNLGLNNIDRPIYLEVSSSGQALFKCGNCDLSNINSACFFYIDYNNRLIGKINGISYTFLTFDSVNIGTSLIPNIYSLYLQGSSYIFNELVIQTRSYPSFPSKTLEINRLVTLEINSLVCESIRWIDSPTLYSRIVLY